MSRRTISRMLAATGAAALGAALLGAGPALAETDPRVETVATGLNSPRQLSFSPDGTLYVAESGYGDPGADPAVEGSGNCQPLSAGPVACLGFTGSVARVSEAGVERVLTGLPSTASDAEAIGPFDIAFTGNHRFALTIGAGAAPEVRDAFGADGEGLGTIVSGSLKAQHRGGELSLVFDAVDHEALHDADGQPDSNPTGLARSGNGYAYVDAGGNTLVSTRGGGSTLAYFAPVPTSLPGPVPAGFPAQAVPTDVAKGPDGAWYVSQLVGFPFEKGASTIWRVVPGQEPEAYATGLTNVTSLAFAEDGTLYVVELATEGLMAGPPVGALYEITPGGDQHEVVVGDLEQPYGLAIRDGAAYLTTGAIAPAQGGGSVVRVEL